MIRSRILSKRAQKIPFSNKISVDVEAIRTAIEDIRLGLPNEISQARAIVADRNNILVKAKNEAVSAVTSAQEKSRALVSSAEDKVRGYRAQDRVLHQE